jgi:prepilin-type N-terminal cleavage/methylation domain-containing protein
MDFSLTQSSVPSLSSPALKRSAADRRQAGFTLVEMMIAIMAFTTVALTLLQHLTISYSSSRTHRERVFAYSKAQAILAEMHAMVDSGATSAAIDLDAFDDGLFNNPVLSIETQNGNLILPDSPLSGNTLGSAGWEWYRRIKVRPFASIDNRSVRYVTVKIFHRNGMGDENEVASLSSVVNSVSSGFPTTQVYDVYLLAVENIPGWWVFMENIVPSVEAAITDLESRNPGLSLRTHWITKASYGRNEQYTPYINNDLNSHESVPYAYYYPGSMPEGSSSNYYYVPSMIDARMLHDGALMNGYDAIVNPHPYALADYFNHGMRLPRERALHALRMAAIKERKATIRGAIQSNTTPPPELLDMSEEPTMRLLLEDMNTNPEKYRHALLINVHGELVPMPAIRNYSDPAKCVEFPGMRTVTHPEELRTDIDDDAYLRVYCWSSEPDVYHTDPEARAGFITVDIMDVNLVGETQNGPVHAYSPFHDSGWIRAMPGGVTVSGSNEYPSIGMTDSAYPKALNYYEGPYPWAPEKPMRYSVFFGSMANGRKFTRIYLVNTPVHAAEVTSALGAQGLRSNERSRLYGLEYNPAPTRDTDFTRDLAAVGDGPKNTARWRLKLPKELLSQGTRWFNEDGTPLGAAPSGDLRLTVRTWFLDSTTPWPEQPGKMYPTRQSPDNMSETYVYWGDSREAVPFTERSQFCGDPRFNPYKDLLNGDPDYGDGYNWFFDAFNSDISADFPGIVRKFDRWNGSVRQDLPRYFEMFRSGLVSSEAVYTTLTGYSYYYMGVGNEIGFDIANGYPNSIPVSLRPFGGDPLETGFVNNITGSRRYVRDSRDNDDFWYCMPWLGELYPAGVMASQWNVNGNLSAGNDNELEFHRAVDSTCQNNTARFRAHGTNFNSAGQRLATAGCLSFMNNGTSGAHFSHFFAATTTSLVGPGVELAENYNFPLPATIYINRPFAVNAPGSLTPEWSYPPYSTNRFHASTLEEYYDFGAATGSGLVMLEGPAKDKAAYVIVSGVGQTAEVGSAFIAKYSVLAMIHSYFEVGSPSVPHRIAQLPRVEIKSPNELTELVDPLSINLQFDLEWLRWDGGKYTASTSTSFVEDESSIEYSVMYSADNGVNWTQLQMVAGLLQATTMTGGPGVHPGASLMVADTAVGQEALEWDLPRNNYPESVYLVRVEAYRAGQQLHYSQHMQRFYIDR